MALLLRRVAELEANAELLPGEVLKRARHVVTENQRVLEYPKLGSLLDTAYASTPGTCRGEGYQDVVLDEVALEVRPLWRTYLPIIFK